MSRFERALEKLNLDDAVVADETYRALCNVIWRHSDGEEWTCSWRTAGAIVADLRRRGEDYLDYYCLGREGEISPRVASVLAEAGWTPHQYPVRTADE